MRHFFVLTDERLFFTEEQTKDMEEEDVSHMISHVTTLACHVTVSCDLTV